MNLESEIIEVVQSAIAPDFVLLSNPVSFYSKNGLNWVKISLIYQSDDVKIRYAYNGYLNNDGQLKSRDCHSERHREISIRISEALNHNKIGQKLNAHFS